MGCYGFLLVLMGTYMSIWILIDPYASVCVSMCPLLVFMHPYASLWVSNGSLEVFMRPIGFQLVLMGL